MEKTSYFKKASKSLAKAKLAITGPSGSGKTLSSLLLAKGLGGKVGVIDTENNSASLYEDRFPGWEYFVLPINPPYTAQKYLKAIDIAVIEGMDVLIIDSLSHVWAAEGGLLQQKEALDSRGGNSFSNWGQITKVYEQLKSKILHSPIHVIATMRSKQQYILEQTDKGKQAPRKVGLEPVMRDGIEYEFTVVFDLGMDHQFMVSKDRTDLFDGVVSMISEDTGIQIRDWLKSDPPPAPPEPEKQVNDSPEVPTDEQKFPEDEPQSHPPVEEMSQEPKSGQKRSKKKQDETPDLFDYVMTAGEFAGKKIRDVNEAQLKSVLMWSENQMKNHNPHNGQLSKVFKTNTTLKQFFKSIGQWPVNYAPGDK